MFKIFSKSPIHPLQKHMNKVYECVSLLKPFFEAVNVEKWKKAELLQLKIRELENEADTIKRDLRLHLPRGLFMAISRSDVLELVRTQDSIANKAKDIAGLVLGRNMVIPSLAKEAFDDFLQRSLDAVKLAKKAIDELDSLLESGFGGREVEIVESMINNLLKLERETDEIQIDVRRAIFKVESELPPINVVFLYKITEWIGDLADRAQHVADRLQILIAQ